MEEKGKGGRWRTQSGDRLRGKKGEREATPSVGLGREEDPSFEMRMYLSIY